MLRRAFGRTGLELPLLGFGAMQAGSPEIDEAHAGRLLNEALDLGLTLIDSARSYGLSEERIARHLAHRRTEFVLSTKVGYGVAGIADWTAECIVAGVEAACRRLATETIDIVHLHSCPLATLEAGEVMEALVRCRSAGKLRVAAYSGDGSALAHAIRCGVFGSVQASLSLVDQANLPLLVEARARGLGIIAKRPLAGRSWAIGADAADPVAREYRRRFELISRERGAPLADWEELALRFAAWAAEVDCCLVGSTSSQHLSHNLRIVEAGPLPASEAQGWREAFVRVGSAWPPLV